MFQFFLDHFNIEEDFFSLNAYTLVIVRCNELHSIGFEELP
jgi:hypothetical protein